MQKTDSDRDMINMYKDIITIHMGMVKFSDFNSVWTWLAGIEFL